MWVQITKPTLSLWPAEVQLAQVRPISAPTAHVCREAAWWRKASEDLETMWGLVISKQARHERVYRKMIRAMAKQMYATVNDSRDEEFAASAGWRGQLLN